MKRLLVSAAIVLVIVVFTACSPTPDVQLCASPAQTVVPAVSPAVTVLPLVSPVTEITPAPTSSLESTSAPSPTTIPSFPDSHIPDTEAAGEHIANSGDSLYEDEHYIYFSYEYSPDLFIIDKQNKTQQTVPYACRFTVYNGKVYYADVPLGNYEGEHPDSSCIKEYDPQTGKEKQIEKLKNGIFSIAYYKGKLYFTYVTVYNEEAETSVTDLYSIKLNGSDKELIQKDVCTFCIYNDFIYFTSTEGVDGAELYKCGLDGNGMEKLLDWAGWNFEIANNRLYYNNSNDDYDSVSTIDLGTHEKADLLEGFYNFTLFGQYVLYVSDALYVYDMNTQNTYDLMELGDNEVYLYATEYNAYIAVCKEDITELYSIVIRDSKASLESVADIEGGTE